MSQEETFVKGGGGGGTERVVGREGRGQGPRRWSQPSRGGGRGKEVSAGAEKKMSEEFGTRTW